jgi:hypothetical protein
VYLARSTAVERIVGSHRFHSNTTWLASVLLQRSKQAKHRICLAGSFRVSSVPQDLIKICSESDTAFELVRKTCPIAGLGRPPNAFSTLEAAMLWLFRPPYTRPVVVLRSWRENNGVIESTVSLSSRAVALLHQFPRRSRGNRGDFERLHALVASEGIKGFLDGSTGDTLAALESGDSVSKSSRRESKGI